MSDDYLKMQQSAAERVRDMQRRVDGYSQTKRQDLPPKPDKHKEPPSPPPKHQAAPNPLPAKKNILGKGGELLKMLNFGGIEMDSDRALVAAMMLLLVSESDDELLILALLYIML